MRFALQTLLVSGFLFLNACSPVAPKKDSYPWTISYWVWPDNLPEPSDPSDPSIRADAIYVNVGAVNRFAGIQTRDWPPDLPIASQYWALWRYESPPAPTEKHLPALVAGFEKVRNQALIRGQQVLGLQIDYDCPTGELSQYGLFLARLRKELPPGTLLSVTALLDWFRPGTNIDRMLAHVSEFVPQFYDVGERGEGTGLGIAKLIDPARWAPLFNSCNVPYRVGISAFGRISLFHNGKPSYFRDIAPIDVLGRSGLQYLKDELTPAGEKRFLLRVARSLRIGYADLDRDDRVELVLPTRESLSAAYRAAKNMGGFCTGVVFFRWPAPHESLVLTPKEIQVVTAGSTDNPAPTSLTSVEGDCVAVHCSDLHLRLENRFPKRDETRFVRSSQPLEYFLPEPRLKSGISLSGRGVIKVRLPAYHGEQELLLGRAVTLRAARFTLEEETREPK